MTDEQAESFSQQLEALFASSMATRRNGKMLLPVFFACQVRGRGSRFLMP